MEPDKADLFEKTYLPNQREGTRL